MSSKGDPQKAIIDPELANQRIRTALDYFKTTVEAVCDDIKVSSRTYRRYKQRGEFPLWFVRDVADYFGMSFEDFTYSSEPIFLEKLAIARQRQLTASRKRAETLKKLDPILQSMPSHLHAYTIDTINRFSHLRSIFISSRAFGTMSTPYAIIDVNLSKEIKERLKSERFYLIYGNSARGKTFFVCSLVDELIKEYDILIYYSPHLHYGRGQNIDSILQPIKDILSTGSRLLLIMDDSHLSDELLKKTILYSIADSRHDRLHLLMISRNQEEESIPRDYLTNTLCTNFNKIAEQTFDKILDLFYRSHKMERPELIENELRQEIEGSNLVFLTLMLQSWDSLLHQGIKPSVREISRNAYTQFLSHYEENFSDNWKYINHVVSALFQYEIRIDRRYLSKSNPDLERKGIDEYLKDKMVHPKWMAQDNEERPFYVFADFARTEEKDMMKHAGEFRFYLEAYKNLLSFGARRDLDRAEFTKLVLKHYLLFRPKNLIEVHDLIRINAGEEKETLLAYLYNDPEIQSIMKKAKYRLLKEGLESNDT
jgi:hypothetical protein